jgi:hypothetical protein
VRGLLVAHLLFVGSLVTGGCATLEKQAQISDESVASALLDDIGTYAVDEVQCDPQLLAQLAAFIASWNLTGVIQGIGCLPVAAKELANQVRSGIAAAPPKEHLQTLRTAAAVYKQVKVMATAKPKGP